MDKFKMSKSQIWEKFLEKKNFLVEVVLLNVLSLNKNRLWFKIKNRSGNCLHNSFARSTHYIEPSRFHRFAFLVWSC
jgi:hypothetical protein